MKAGEYNSRNVMKMINLKMNESMSNSNNTIFQKLWLQSRAAEIFW